MQREGSVAGLWKRRQLVPAEREVVTPQGPEREENSVVHIGASHTPIRLSPLGPPRLHRGGRPPNLSRIFNSKLWHMRGKSCANPQERGTPW